VVEIPEVLIKRLQGLGPHFIRVAKRGKEPIDKGWTQPENMMTADDPRLQAWLEEGGNYGVSAGYGLNVLEVDAEEVKQMVKDKLPESFTDESPGHKGWHYYFLGSIENKIYLRTKDGEHAGAVLGPGFMVVGPRSIHPNGGVYTIINGAPLAQVSRQQLEAALGDYIVPEREVQIIEETARKEGRQAGVDLDILRVLPLSGLRKQGEEYYGPHPVHGSETGRNLWINPLKNCWHCFRHGSGGGPLLWLAVQEGIIKCEEAGPGALRGDVFKRVLEKARERGLVQGDVKAKKEVGLEEIINEFKGKDTYPILLKTIGYTVKRDNIAKQHDLLHVSSMYAAPINELKEAPPSEGKTYPLMQIIRLFPREDVMVLGGLSPTALAHDYGIPVDPTGKDLRPRIQEIRDKIEKLKDQKAEAERGEKEKIKREIEKLQREIYELTKDSKRLIDLENKVIVFVDNPDPRTWARLRPIMSHDKWETSYKFTDRTSKSGPLKQITVVLRGWPVFIAFKAEETPNKGWTREIWQQILTRGTTVPVEMSSEKYKEAIKLTGVKKGLPQPVLNRELQLDEFRKCQRIVRAIRHRILTMKQRVREQTGCRELPNIFWIPFHDVVTENFPHRKGTHMREADRFLSIVQNHAVANVFNRPTIEIDGVPYLICTIRDLQKAIELYFSEEARKTIFSKIPTNQIKFFEEVIVPLSEQWPGGVDTVAMQKKYKEVFDESISINTINYHYLQPLENMDLISRDDDPNDKRRKLTIPLREKVFAGEAQICTLFEKGDIFTLENLKEASKKLEKLIVRDTHSNIVKIKDYDGSVIDVDALYDKYFSKNALITRGMSNNYLSEQGEETKPKKEWGIVPVPKKGIIPESNLTFEQILSGPIALPAEMWHKGTCEICGEEKTIEWHVVDFNRERHEICGDCAWAYSDYLK